MWAKIRRWGGGYLKCVQRAGCDWLNLGLHRGVASGTRRGGEEIYIFFFLWHFSLYKGKKMGTGASLERDHRPAPDQRAPH